MMPPPRLRPLLLLAAGLGLLLFAAFGPVLTRGPFGINDDYQYLYRVHHRTFDPAHNEQTGMGRPVAAWGLNAAFALCDGRVARLAWLRGISLAGVALFAWTLGRTLLALGYPTGFAATVAALAAVSPAGGVYAAWAAGLLSPFALTAALLAGLILERANGWPARIGAALLLVAACATWQAAAPMALFPALAAAWSACSHPAPSGCPGTATERRGYKAATGIVTVGESRWWLPWLVCAGAVACYLAASRLLVRLGTFPTAGADRMALATDPFAKLRLLGDLLRSGATSWARLQPGAWEWAVGLLTAGACLGAVVRGSGSLRRAGLAAAMVLVSVSPLLAAREHNAAFRALPILYATVAFLGVQGIFRFLHGRAAWVRAGVPLAVVVASAGAARYHVWHGLVVPNYREFAGLREQVRQQFPAGAPARLVYLVPPPILLAAGRLTPSWEYGLVSSPFWWVTRPFLLQLFEENGTPADPASLAISYREAGNPGVPVLDTLPVILREPGRWRDDPRWGRVREFPHGWLYSPWFGYFNVEELPIIQHPLLGSLLFTSRPEDGGLLWFHHRELGQFHTSAAVFPHLFLGRQNGWFMLSDDDRAHAFLVSDVTGDQMPVPR